MILDDLHRTDPDVREAMQEIIEKRLNEKAERWVDEYAKSIPEIGLKNFIAKQKALLTQFETYWIEQRMMDVDSETFPAKMRESDWLDALEDYQTNSQE